MPQEVALSENEGCRLGVRGDRRQRQVEQDLGDRRVDLLVRFDLAVAEVEEGLPTDVAPRRRKAAEQVVSVAWLTAFFGVEDDAEERRLGRVRAIAGAAREVGPVG